jgi:hypothetical protein
MALVKEEFRKTLDSLTEGCESLLDKSLSRTEYDVNDLKAGFKKLFVDISSRHNIDSTRQNAFDFLVDQAKLSDLKSIIITGLDSLLQDLNDVLAVTPADKREDEAYTKVDNMLNEAHKQLSNSLPWQQQPYIVVEAPHIGGPIAHPMIAAATPPQHKRSLSSMTTMSKASQVEDEINNAIEEEALSEIDAELAKKVLDLVDYIEMEEDTRCQIEAEIKSLSYRSICSLIHYIHLASKNAKNTANNAQANTEQSEGQVEQPDSIPNKTEAGKDDPLKKLEEQIEDLFLKEDNGECNYSNSEVSDSEDDNDGKVINLRTVKKKLIQTITALIEDAAREESVDEACGENNFQEAIERLEVVEIKKVIVKMAEFIKKHHTNNTLGELVKDLKNNLTTTETAEPGANQEASETAEPGANQKESDAAEPGTNQEASEVLLTKKEVIEILEEGGVSLLLEILGYEHDANESENLRNVVIKIVSILNPELANDNKHIEAILQLIKRYGLTLVAKVIFTNPVELVLDTQALGKALDQAAERESAQAVLAVIAKMEEHQVLSTKQLHFRSIASRFTLPSLEMLASAQMDQFWENITKDDTLWGSFLTMARGGETEENIITFINKNCKPFHTKDDIKSPEFDVYSSQENIDALVAGIAAGTISIPEALGPAAPAGAGTIPEVVELDDGYCSGPDVQDGHAPHYNPGTMLGIHGPTQYNNEATLDCLLESIGMQYLKNDLLNIYDVAALVELALEASDITEFFQGCLINRQNTQSAAAAALPGHGRQDSDHNR